MAKKHESYINLKFEKYKENYGKELDEFYSFMQEFPYLGASHSFGKKIINSISRFPKVLETDSFWYRARKIGDEKEFEQNDMWSPDPSKIEIAEGRFNHFGQSYTYISETEQAAAKEKIRDGNEDEIWIQKIRINEIKNLLDIRDIAYNLESKMPLIALGIIHSGQLRQKQKSKFSKPEYFIPRFIADAAKLNKFEGIVYKSNYHKSDNMVLFGWCDCYCVERPYKYTVIDNN